MADFETNYPQNPWQAVTQDERPWYFPQLAREYRRRTVYGQYVGVKFNHNGPRASELYLDTLIRPHANHDPAGLRDIWGNSSRFDSFRSRITFSRYTGKLSLNRYEDLTSYWLLDGTRGLVNIIRSDEGLGYMITEVMDKLARDAFMRAPFKKFGAGTGVDFGDITTNDRLTVNLIDDMILGLKERDIPAVTTGDGSPGNLVCITSPGMLRDLRYELAQDGNTNLWMDRLKYTNSVKLLNGEVGSVMGVRFVETNRACLYNAGEITNQTTITAAVTAGDGSPDPSNTTVDGVEYVGQPGATHYITVADSSGFAVGDVVSIHVDRTNSNGITNGVDYTDGKKIERRIVSKPNGTRLAFDRPVQEDFSIDLGGGVYGYVTLARNIHTAVFIAANDGVVMSTAQPPTLHTPPPIDDFDMIYRFTWDAYMGYQVFNKNAFEALFLAGSNRMTGARY